MIVNFNIGVLGHVDSGKTTLTKKLSTIASTASFDKSNQSQERGITLDLGFSALTLDIPEHLKLTSEKDYDLLQLTFVDCPGHSSLIRTIIGGIQIIDMMVLVIDALKGFQTQTAECLVIAELTKKDLIIVVNKIDAIDETAREKTLKKLEQKILKTLATTSYKEKIIPIYFVSALLDININELIDDLKSQVYIPKRNIKDPLLFYVDHCFSIKGQGTILTGTVIQGAVSLNDIVELPTLHEQRKIKSIQMFRKPVSKAEAGDRIGICISKINSNLMERGIVCKPQYLQTIYAAVININLIKYYKLPIKSKSKFHFSIGHETVLGKLTIFFPTNENDESFGISNEYEYLDEIIEIENKNNYFALIEFELPVLCKPNAVLIGSKLDITNPNSCRIALWGNIAWSTTLKTYSNDCLPLFNIFKRKFKQGSIQRIINENEVIVQNLFKKENRDLYIGKKVFLSTGEEGLIESTFGQTSKIKITFFNKLSSDTLDKLHSKNNDIKINLNFKKYIFNKEKRLEQ